MKFITYLLIITISFLAFKPAFDAMGFGENCCTSQCSVLDMDDNEKEEKKDCKDYNCNPFQTCCSNVLLIAEPSLVNIESVLTFPKQNFTFQGTYQFTLAADFWQPPRFLA